MLHPLMGKTKRMRRKSFVKHVEHLVLLFSSIVTPRLQHDDDVVDVDDGMKKRVLRD